eukprot:gb/GECH01012067.1/.p1 GENE.gb/GECH01012067.1/~~gb/GECH01012067.1/.p1  ORF type:complete len:1036 (+),score=292.95 gb/GECH01012067.1/:1-3108(+)
MSKIEKIASSFARRDQLKEVEEKVQKQWNEQRIFEKDAPENWDPETRDKFLVTFPYPYMNGLMHIGHAFTLTKCEFAVGYKSLKGSDILFPFGFHCTGMPISANALKLKRALEGEDSNVDVSKMKSKVAAKGGGLSQIQILQGMGIPDEEIPKFTDPSYWLNYFPPKAQDDLKRFGLRVDWRRSFITTDANPFYDSFVRWQFNSLKAQGKVQKGLRYTIFSPADGQPCADHDRSSGEGLNPQEYTIVKMRVQTPFPEKLKSLEGRNVFFAAATLRPETMYGQTNCWILPEGDYGAFEIYNGDVLIMTERAARNLAYQNKTKTPKEVNCLATFKGSDLIGVPLSAPNSPFDAVYTLPMLTISPNKGTGVVTSVPSDSPDDFAVLRDLKNKEKLREKFGVKDEWVLPFEPVPIIEIPELNTQNAGEMMVNKLKIKSQNDKQKLEEAKKEVYQKGFYTGKLIVGPYAGQKVNDIKDQVKNEMVEKGEALIYYEPEGLVISRSGDECIVALAEQWYILYGEEQWKQKVKNHLESMTFYSDSTRHQFEKTLDWLKEWACSRSFGLGTKLPFDPDWLIDSLSDSTIYMAYYTVSHLLHQGSLDGSVSPNGIKPEDMTDAVWDYIFQAGDYPNDCNISEELLKKCRREFEYWYPVDLRVSGKDLIQNHLTMFLYNHAAMFAENQQPGSIYTNGHVVVNNEKMSKNKGNFFLLRECIDRYSADATRFALADAGDGMDDANFVEETANSAILRFTNLFGFAEQLKTSPELFATEGDLEFSDRVFMSRINRCIEETDANYAAMLFREALKTGYFDMQQALSHYRTETEKRGMRKDLVERFAKVQALLLCPITPHVSEHMWNLLGQEGSIMQASWPESGEIDEVLMQQHDFLRSTTHEFNSKLQKARKNLDSDKSVSVYIFCCTSYLPWQLDTIRAVREVYNETGEIPKSIAKKLSSNPDLKKQMKKVMPFVAYLKEQVTRYGSRALNDELPFDEVALIQENANLFKSQLGVSSVNVYPDSSDAPNRDKSRKESSPGNPAVAFVNE